MLLEASTIQAPGDELAIRIGEFEWLITVKALSSQRGPAEAARKLYEEDEASRARRVVLYFFTSPLVHFQAKQHHRQIATN